MSPNYCTHITLVPPSETAHMVAHTRHERHTHIWHDSRRLPKELAGRGIQIRIAKPDFVDAFVCILVRVLGTRLRAGQFTSSHNNPSRRALFFFLCDTIETLFRPRFAFSLDRTRRTHTRPDFYGLELIKFYCHVAAG